MAEEPIGEAVVETEVDLDGLDKGIDEAEAKTKSGFAKIGDIMKGALSVGIAAGATVIAAGIAGIASGIGDAREAAQIMAQTQAVITSTGGAAGYTADEIADMAGALSAASGKSLFGDSDIQQGQNLLLTFTNIKETLPDATQTMVDLAQAMGTDVKGGAIQLGKALNDPINGVSALSRVGVTFTEEQKDQIRTMQEAGDMAGAQQIILAELNKEFGGSAAAAAAADGGMAQFNDQIGELWETIGALFLPIINQAMGFLNTTAMPILTSIVDAISGVAGAFGDAGAGSSEFGEAAGYLATQLGLPGEQVQNLIFWLQDNLGPAIDQVVTWFQTMIPAAIATLTTYWETVLLPVITSLIDLWSSQLQPALTELLGWFQTQLPVAIQFLSDIWNNVLLPAIQTVSTFVSETVIPIIGQLVQWLRDNLPKAAQVAADFWNDVLAPALAAVWAFINDPLIPIITLVAEWLGETLPPIIQALSDFFTETLVPALTAVWTFIQTSVIPILAMLAEWIGQTLPPIIRSLASFFTNTLIPALSAVWNYIQGNVIPILTSLATSALAGVKTAAEGLASFWNGTLLPAFRKIGSVVDDTVKPAISAVAKAFSDTLTPAINGMKELLANVVTWFTNIGTAISGVITWIGEMVAALSKVEIPDWLKGHSPPPLADWFSYIADSASDVTAALPSFTGMGIGNLQTSALAAPTGASGATQAEVSLSLNDNGMGWLRNLIQVEVATQVNGMARSGQNRGR